jgi:hypothetical protein
MLRLVLSGQLRLVVLAVLPFQLLPMTFTLMLLLVR